MKDRPDLIHWVESGPGRFRARVPADCAYFAGHFPGNPVLPAFGQLALLEQLVRRSFGALWRVVCLRRVRFEAVIGADEELEVELLRRDELTVEAHMMSGGRRVTSGVLMLESAEGGVEPEGIPSLALSAGLQLPQVPPATYIAEPIDGLSHPGRVPVGVSDSSPILLVQDGTGGLSSMVAVELMAQAMAVREGGVDRDTLGEGRREGYIVRIERAEFAVGGLLPGVTYEVQGVCQQSGGGLARWAAELFGVRGSLARMQFSTFSPGS